MILIDQFVRILFQDRLLPRKCNVDIKTKLSTKECCKCKHFCSGMMYLKDGQQTAVFLPKRNKK